MFHQLRAFSANHCVRRSIFRSQMKNWDSILLHLRKKARVTETHSLGLHSSPASQHAFPSSSVVRILHIVFRVMRHSLPCQCLKDTIQCHTCSSTDLPRRANCLQHRTPSPNLLRAQPRRSPDATVASKLARSPRKRPGPQR